MQTPVFYCDGCKFTYTLGCGHSHGNTSPNYSKPVFDNPNAYEHEKMTQKELRLVHILMLLIMNYLYRNGYTAPGYVIRMTRKFMTRFNNISLDLELFIAWAVSRDFLKPRREQFEMTNQCLTIYLDLLHTYFNSSQVCYPRLITKHRFIFETYNDAMETFKTIGVITTDLYCCCCKNCKYLKNPSVSCPFTNEHPEDTIEFCAEFIFMKTRYFPKFYFEEKKRKYTN
jgi:hypothetical protein